MTVTCNKQRQIDKCGSPYRTQPRAVILKRETAQVRVMLTVTSGLSFSLQLFREARPLGATACNLSSRPWGPSRRVEKCRVSSKLLLAKAAAKGGGLGWTSHPSTVSSGQAGVNQHPAICHNLLRCFAVQNIRLLVVPHRLDAFQDQRKTSRLFWKWYSYIFAKFPNRN